MLHLDRLADMAEKSLDLDAILALARPLTPQAADIALRPAAARPAHRARQRRGVHIPLSACRIAHWRKAGAEIVPFSPLADEAPAADCDVCWLPGGYPELHAGRLAAADRFREGMRQFAERRPVHGECGGFMVLGEMLEDAAGETAPDARTARSFDQLCRTQDKSRLSPRSAAGRLRARPKGTEIRGHEFHYARLTDPVPTTNWPTLRMAKGATSAPSAAVAALSPARSSTRSREAEQCRGAGHKTFSTISLLASASIRACRCRWESQRSFADAQWAAPVAGLVVGAIGWLVFFLADICRASRDRSRGPVRCGDHRAHRRTARGWTVGHRRWFRRRQDARAQSSKSCATAASARSAAAALILSILLRWAALAALATPLLVFCALLASHAAARAMMPMFMRLVAPARSDGLSANAGAIPDSFALTWQV